MIWLVWQVCGWFRVLQLTEHETVFLKRRSLILSLVVGSISFKLCLYYPLGPRMPGALNLDIPTIKS